MPNNNVLDVASAIIEASNEIENCRHKITNLRLQKLLYFVQGYCYSETKEPMFNQEMEAWKLGPVSIEAYNKYCAYGSSQIPNQQEHTNLSEEDENIIKTIVYELKDVSTWDLVEETHKESPWKFAYNFLGNRSIIKNEYIRKEFAQE